MLFTVWRLGRLKNYVEQLFTFTHLNRYFVNYKFYDGATELLNSEAKSDLRISINSLLSTLNLKHIRWMLTIYEEHTKTEAEVGIAANFYCKETFWILQLTKYLHLYIYICSDHCAFILRRLFLVLIFETW